MYKAIADFVDLKDNNHKYNAGDQFPRKGYKPDKDRLAELLSSDNKRGTAVIAEVKPEEKEVSADKPKKGRKKNDVK